MATLLRRVTDVMCMLKAWHSIKRLRKLVSRPVSRNIISMKTNGPEISATLKRPWHQPPTWYSATPPHLWMRSSTLSVLSTWPWNPLETSPTQHCKKPKMEKVKRAERKCCNKSQRINSLAAHSTQSQRSQSHQILFPTLSGPRRVSAPGGTWKLQIPRQKLNYAKWHSCTANVTNQWAWA